MIPLRTKSKAKRKNWSSARWYSEQPANTDFKVPVDREEAPSPIEAGGTGPPIGNNLCFEAFAESNFLFFVGPPTTKSDDVTAEKHKYFSIPTLKVRTSFRLKLVFKIYLLLRRALKLQHFRLAKGFLSTYAHRWTDTTQQKFEIACTEDTFRLSPYFTCNLTFQRLATFSVLTHKQFFFKFGLGDRSYFF